MTQNTEKTSPLVTVRELDDLVTVREPARRKKRKLPKVISGVEAERLFQVVQSEKDGVRNVAMLAFMYYAGLRVSEVCNLALRDVSREGVIRLYDAKGGDGTAYFAVDIVLPLLDRWLQVRDAWAGNSNLIFVMRSGRPVSTRYLQRLLKKAKEDAGIIGICTPHVLRHSFATSLIEEGYTLPEVQQALRHANLQTTAIYLHVHDEALRRKLTRRGGEA